MADLIEVAAYETKCTVMVQLREATARQVLLCGRLINVQSHVEVQALDGKSAMQVIMCSENNTFSRPADISEVLPQIACKALALAAHTPFGNERFKTVYSVSLHSVCTKDAYTPTIQMHAILVKCHLSSSTLSVMGSCPIVNYLQPSYIIHKKIKCPNFQSPDFITFFYKAFKAIFLAFQGSELCGKVNDVCRLQE
ncbi:uncharacterized protein [Ptychodera flava]|uniref:uncharacterized protein n=1 Tax=Ptychodera flava TaxID=63121 RepID=UPI00396A50C9